MSDPASRRPDISIAVIGGGVVGLAASEALLRAGVRVTLYESAPRLGGLLGGTEIGGSPCDRFYHVVLSSDRETRAWIDGLGLGGKLAWSEAGSGFYGRGRLAPLAGSGDFLRFPFLSFPRKVRLGLGILLAAATRDPSGPASVAAERWLRRRFGSAVTRSIWMPLLRGKLGSAAPRASAVFIWSSIRRLLSARKGPSARESWGGLRGGMRGLAAAAEASLRSQGADIRTGCRVLRIEPLDGGGVRLETEARSSRHDAVLVTVPGPEAARLLPPGSAAAAAWEGIEYLGVTALLVLLRRPLSPYYILNLLDESLPFTGIIEMTNVLPPAEFGGRSLVYLPKYAVAADSPSADDSEIQASFLGGLRSVFRDLWEDDILAARVERSAWAQPLHTPGPLDPLPAEALRPAPGIFVANTALLTRTVSNMDASLRLGRETARSILEGLGRKPAAEEGVATRETPFEA